MRLKRKTIEHCYRCDRPVDIERAGTHFQLTRVDPYTRIQRPITQDEGEDVRQRRRANPRLHLWNLGIYLACICQDCADIETE